MDFTDAVRSFGERAKQIRTMLETEEATKHALILPFFQLLGYNIFDPAEVVPEFVADVGVKKGEKVDYAICVGGKPAILVEAKPHWDDLSKHDSQLYRYFSVTEARFAVLTNGIQYKFYSDLQEPNKLDDQPFLEFSILEPNEAWIAELKKFHRDIFNPDELLSTAAMLKYSRLIRQRLQREMREPTDELLRVFLKDIHPGRITQSVLDQFRPIVRKAMNQFVNDLITERIQTAMQNEISEDGTTKADQPTEGASDAGIEEGDSKIVTTMEEMEAFFIIKTLLRQTVDPTRISFKDNVNYFAILLDGNARKWICRLYLHETRRYIQLYGQERSQRIQLSGLDDLFHLQDQLTAVVQTLTTEPA